MKYLLALVLFIAGCSSVAPPASVTYAPAPQFVTPGELFSKTVALVDQQDETVDAYCSGVWVSNVAIMTALHCMGESKIGDRIGYVVKSDVYQPGDLHEQPARARLAKLYAVDEAHDLALLADASPPDHTFARISMEPVEQGQRVFAMGAPLGMMFSYSSGDVAALRYVTSHGHEILFIQTTAPISGGSSGGGLYNVYGELVGICHATFTKGQNMNLFIHYQYVDALVRGNAS